MNFADQLKTARKSLKLSQVKFAELLNVPRRTYQDWEYNKYEPAKYNQDGILEKVNKMIQEAK